MGVDATAADEEVASLLPSVVSFAGDLAARLGGLDDLALRFEDLGVDSLKGLSADGDAGAIVCTGSSPSSTWVWGSALVRRAARGRRARGGAGGAMAMAAGRGDESAGREVRPRLGFSFSIPDSDDLALPSAGILSVSMQIAVEEEREVEEVDVEDDEEMGDRVEMEAESWPKGRSASCPPAHPVVELERRSS